MADEQRRSNRPSQGGQFDRRPAGGGGRGPGGGAPGGRGGRPGGPPPQRRPEPPANRAPQGNAAPRQKRPARTELPVLINEEDMNEDALPEGMLYIAYGEKGDDVAFELCDELEEALGVYEIMKEDGFTPRLFQAQELDIVEE